MYFLYPAPRKTALALIALLAVTPVAYADNEGHGHGHGHERGPSHATATHDDGSNAVSDIVEGAVRGLLGDKDREILRGYLHDNKERFCPPGLAKKHNGCLPPGHAKKYQMGGHVPAGDMESLPREILRRLSLPKGYRVGRIDNDIVLYSDRDRRIVDAVTALSSALMK